MATQIRKKARAAAQRAKANPPIGCASCLSTAEGECSQTTVQEHGGIHDAKPYTHIIRKWIRCPDCSQMRIELSYENRGEGGSD